MSLVNDERDGDDETYLGFGIFFFIFGGLEYIFGIIVFLFKMRKSKLLLFYIVPTIF